MSLYPQKYKSPLQRILIIIPFRICKKNSISFKRPFNNRNEADIENYRNFRSMIKRPNQGELINNEGILYTWLLDAGIS